MKSESEWKTQLVREAKAMGWYARRIEDQYGVGFPDMIMRPPACVPAFIEVKLVSGRSYAPSPRQYIDLISLHEPPYSYGVVLGISVDHLSSKRSLGFGHVFSFSMPLKRIDMQANSTFHHVNFHRGLAMFLDNLRRQSS